MISTDNIKLWIKDAPKKATHMIVVCDTFSYDDYPVYVMKYQSVREVAASYNGKNMQRVMEVYNLKKSIKKQLAEHRSFNF